MKGIFQKSYKSKNGNTVFVYAVTGSESELVEFAEAQGEHFVEGDNGEALFFTVNYAGNRCDLIITSKGNVIADMSAFDQMSSLAEQYEGTPLGAELAKAAAQKLIGGLDIATPAKVVAPSTPAVSADEKELGDA